MAKTHKISTALFVLFTAFCSTFALSADKHTQVPEQCQQLFKATEKVIAEAKRQPGTHSQLNKIQNKLNQSKEQILQMELATQIKSCDQGLAKLSNLNKAEKTAIN